jgi:hypothetical protein
MKASDKDGLNRGYSAVLWPPDDRTVRQTRVTRFIRWPADGHDRTAIVFDSERARREHLTYAELTEQVARVAALRRGVPEAVSGRFRGNPRGS